MNLLPASLSCSVGVKFGRRGVGLAVRRRRARSFTYRKLAIGENHTGALSALVAQEGIASARCVISLPVGRCRIQWAPLAGVRKRDLRLAVRRSAFWQARMGVARDSHCLWWQLVRDDDGSGVNALLIAAARSEVRACTDAVREAGLAAARVGVSCFDYLVGGIALGACEVTLILDCGDACIVGSGAFGVRASAVEFDESGAEALLDDDSRVRDAIVDNLATCVRRCVEQEQSAARLRAGVRIVTARALQGDWLGALQERLPGLQVEWVDGWTAVGLEEPDSRSPVGLEEPDGRSPVGLEEPDSRSPVGLEEPDSRSPVGLEEPDSRSPVGLEEPDGRSPGDGWRLPRAMATLDYDRQRGGYLVRRRFLPRVNLAEREDGGRQMRRRLTFAAPVGAGLSFAFVLGMHWFLHEGELALQPDALRYERLEQLHEKTLGEVRFLQELLSHRILFYSGIQRISFERKRMPRLLASIEKATLGEVWLDEIHFKRPGFLRIAGKSLGDEQISSFMSRLRTAGEIAEVLLESAVVESAEGVEPHTLRRLKDFAVICKLRFVQQEI